MFTHLLNICPFLYFTSFSLTRPWTPAPLPVQVYLTTSDFNFTPSSPSSQRPDYFPNANLITSFAWFSTACG